MSSNNLNFLLGGSWPKVDSSKPIGITNNGGPSPSRTWFRGSLNCSTLQGFGEEEINMRRKAEALQHRQNQKGMTKAQRWAYAVKHKSTIIDPTCPPPHLKLSNNVLSCDNQVNTSSNNICERVICSSSRSSDVPGPDTTLYLDPTVPFLPLRTNPRQTNAGSLNIPVNTVDLSKDQDCSNGSNSNSNPNPNPNPISSSNPIQLISTPILLSEGVQAELDNKDKNALTIGYPFALPPYAKDGVSLIINNPPSNNEYKIQIKPVGSGFLNNSPSFAKNITNIEYVIICNRKNVSGDYINVGQTQPYNYKPPLTEDNVTVDVGNLEIKPNDKITAQVTVTFDMTKYDENVFPQLPQNRTEKAEIVITAPNTNTNATIDTVLAYKII